MIKYIKITVAAIMYAVGVSLFLDANNLVPGGVSGTAIILNRLTGVEIGTLVFMINIPLLLISIWKFGIRFLLTTIYVIVVSSIFMNIFFVIWWNDRRSFNGGTCRRRTCSTKHWNNI